MIHVDSFELAGVQDITMAHAVWEQKPETASPTLYLGPHPLYGFGAPGCWSAKTLHNSEDFSCSACVSVLFAHLHLCMSACSVSYAGA